MKIIGALRNIIVCMLLPLFAHAYSLEDIMSLSPASLVPPLKFDSVGGFFGERKFVYLAAPPHNMESRGDEFLVMQIIDPLSDRIIETLELNQLPTKPFGMDPKNRVLIKQFQQKYGFKIEKLDLKLEKFPMTISSIRLSPKIVTHDESVNKVRDVLTYSILLKRTDGLTKEITRLKESVPCSNVGYANQVLAGNKPKPLTLTVQQLKSSCKIPEILGYVLSKDKTQSVVVISDFPSGGYAEGGIEWTEVIKLVGVKMNVGFAK